MSIKTYPARIAASMRLTGITQNELAKRCGIRPETMSRKMKRPEQFTGAEMETIRATFRWRNLGGEDE